MEREREGAREGRKWEEEGEGGGPSNEKTPEIARGNKDSQAT